MKCLYYYIILIINLLWASCQPVAKEANWRVSSPDNNLLVNIELKSGRLTYSMQSHGIQVVNKSSLGAIRSDADLSQGLSFVKKSEIQKIDETFTLFTGKSLNIEVNGTYQYFTFENQQGKLLQLDIQVFNDGLGLRYTFPGQSEQTVAMQKDLMEFNLPSNSKAWLQSYDRITTYSPAYEQYYQSGIAPGTRGEFGNGWCFPALFNINEQWLLISDAGIDGNYAGMHLDNQQGNNVYTLRWPEIDEAKGLGEAVPSARLPWQTSWKTIAIGDLNTIVKSNLVSIMSPSNRIEPTSWIKPGRVSWSWLSDHPSPRSYRKLKDFVDLAAEMNWEYSLVDANWDQMEGGTVEDLVRYAEKREVGIMMWYNSGGPHNEVTEAPRNIMYERTSRRQEFRRLQELGVKGVKIDFFQSDKQLMMELYQQILEDAAEFRIMVNFHGCTIPRGWSRTYPNLITMESVKGAECYSFDENYAAMAPEHNTILPFTRNVVGSMDYTPVIFNHFMTPHVTSFAHEIALSVVFESGFLHFGDNVEAYQSLGKEEKQFLKEIPVTWDQVELVSGTPGKDVVLARRKGDTWYVAGINGENKPKQWEIDLARFGAGYSMLKIADGDSTDQLVCTEDETANTTRIEVLPYGGFALKLTPAEKLVSN